MLKQLKYWDLKLDDVLSRLGLMCDLSNSNLSCIQFCSSVICSRTCPDFDCVSFAVLCLL